MYEDISHAGDMWLFMGYPLTMSPWYLNPGFDERDYGATERPRLPKCVDNRPNCVFGLWIEIVFAVRAFYPSDGQRRNDDPLLGPNLTRLAHDFCSFSVFKLSKHSANF